MSSITFKINFVPISWWFFKPLFQNNKHRMSLEFLFFYCCWRKKDFLVKEFNYYN